MPDGLLDWLIAKPAAVDRTGIIRRKMRQIWQPPHPMRDFARYLSETAHNFLSAPLSHVAAHIGLRATKVE
jgi:hypothetical protein